MGKGISISIAADTKDAKRGIQTGLIEPLADASEALDSLADEGESAGRVLERTFEGQQRDTEKLRKEYDKLGDQIRSSGRRGRDFGDDVKEGTDKAKRGMEDFKQESNSTAREAAASFDGSAESIGDAFQEVTANAFAGFGPAGAAAGLAAAAGLGLVLAEVQKQQEAVDELKRRFTDAYATAAEEGRKYLSEAQINEAALDILREQGTEGRKRAEEEARTAGVHYLTIIRAQAGDKDALNAIIEQTAQKEGAVRDAMSPTLEMGDQRVTQEQAELVELENVRKKYEEQLGIQQESTKVADDYLKLQDISASKQAAGNKAAKDAIDVRGAALQAYADKAASIPNPVLVPRVDTSQAEGDLSRFIAKARTPFEVSVFYKPVNRPGTRID